MSSSVLQRFHALCPGVVNARRWMAMLQVAGSNSSSTLSCSRYEASQSYAIYNDDSSRQLAYTSNLTCC